MKSICCGCGLHLGSKPSDVHTDDTVSHGICEPCAHHFKALIGMPLAEYLENIRAPVVVVSPEGTIGIANQKACELLGKSIVEVHGFKGGEVFECEHARRPGGCGQTEHCSGCAIRRTVMYTLETGKPRQRVRAYLNRYRERRPHRYDLIISTEKKGGVVLLKVEEMEAAAVNIRISSNL